MIEREMRKVRRFILLDRVITFLVVAVFVLVADGAARAAYDRTSSDWDGLSDFVQLAKDEAGAANVVASGSIDYSALTPQDAVVLLHPEGSLDVESLSRFLREGGRVVLFDDFGSGDELLKHFQIQRIALPAHPALELRHNPALAIAEPADHQTVHGVSRVVLNHASGVSHKELSPLLFVRSADDDEKTYVALAGAVEKGHLLVVSDSSVPINGMLRFPGNKTFVRNVLHYAYTGVGDVTAKGKIHIVSGAFEQSGTYGDASDAQSAFGKLKFVGDALRDFKRDGFPPLVAYLAAGFGALALGFWVWTRASRVHRAATPRYVKAIPLAVQGGVAGHAALIAAKGTMRSLAVLEIKTSLEEELCAALEIEHAPAPSELAHRAVAANLLTDGTARTLRQLLAYMGQVETLVLSRRADAMRRVRDADVVRCSAQARAIREEVRARKNAA
jgi:hypothetical protein